MTDPPISTQESDIVIEGKVIDAMGGPYGIKLGGGRQTNVTIRGCIIKNAKIGFVTTGASDIIFEDNIVTGCNIGWSIAGNGYMMRNNEVTRVTRFPGTGDADYTRIGFGNGITYDGNWFHDTPQAGIGTSHVDGIQIFTSRANTKGVKMLTVKNNIFEDFSEGIIIQDNYDGATKPYARHVGINIVDNVFVGWGNTSAWGVLIEGAANVRVDNNYVANVKTALASRFGSTSLSFSRNVMENAVVGINRNGQGVINVLEDNLYYGVRLNTFGEHPTLEGYPGIASVGDGFYLEPGSILIGSGIGPSWIVEMGEAPSPVDPSPIPTPEPDPEPTPPPTEPPGHTPGHTPQPTPTPPGLTIPDNQFRLLLLALTEDIVRVLQALQEATELVQSQQAKIDAALEDTGE